MTGLAPPCAIDHVAHAMRCATLIDTRPDFRHVGVWIFDLDNTLYGAETRLFAQIERRMTLFVQKFLGLDHQSARRMQKAYYREHGTTLNGLMRVHGVDPEVYLAFVHDIDLSPLAPDAALVRAVGRLPGRRFVFTNGCRHHAARVLVRLALSELFEDLWDIRTIDFRPKPDTDSYRTVFARVGASAARSAYFDDIARNLAPAHALGCTTVWLRNDSDWSKQGPGQPGADSEHIHYETNNLRGFLEELRI
jgi:putative hydrolase of the HAD superfamily